MSDDCLVGTYRTCRSSADFGYIKEKLYAYPDGFWLEGKGWTGEGMFGLIYGQVRPGGGVTIGERCYDLTAAEAAAWINARSGDEDYTGKYVDDVFPDGEPDGEIRSSEEIPENWDWERERAEKALAAWNGEDVRDIFDVALEILNRSGRDENISDIFIDFQDTRFGEWPKDLSECFQYLAIDKNQCCLMCSQNWDPTSLEMHIMEIEEEEEDE